MNTFVYTPSSIHESLEFMAKYPNAKIIAGGTDLLVRLKDELEWPELIDISHVQPLKGIKKEDDKISIGALTTFSDIIENDLLRDNFGVLVQAAEIVGSPQIRNRGTVAGNIANASPAGDLIPPLYVLEAQIELVSGNGKHVIPIEKFYTGPGKTILKNDELITSVIIPIKEGWKGCFVRLGQRNALTISKVSLALRIKVENKQIIHARVAAGAVAPTVIRAFGTEKALEGREFSKTDNAVKIIIDEVSPISDIRSDANYRKEMCGVLLERALRSIDIKC